MDFVNKAFAQLTDLLKSMTPGARIITGVLLLVVVISLAFLFQHQTSTPDAYLMGGEPFAPSQFGAMEAAFHKAGLSGYAFEGSRVKVPRGQQAAFMAALADEQALPASFGSYLGKAVSASNPFTSRAQQVELLKVAKQNELQFIISKMKGIENASVLYDVQKKNGFAQEDVITASVNVKPLGSQPLEIDRVRVLRHLVASAIAGLKPEAVTVTDLNGNVHPGSSSAGGLGSEDDKYSDIKQKYDKLWESKLTNALIHIPGVVVTVNTELDPETEHEENHTEFDPKSVAVESSETTGEKTMESGPPAGPPGLAAQGNSNQAARIGTVAATKNNDITSKTESRFAVPHKLKRTRQHGLTPKRVTATVGIPSSYYEKIWREQNPAVDGQPAKTPTATELTKIENEVKMNVEKTVVNLLPPSQLDKFPLAVVESFQSIAQPAIPQPALQDHAIAWLGQYWTTLGTAGLALFSLVMLRSMVKSAPVSPPAPAGVNTGAAAASAPAVPTLGLVTDDETGESGEQSARSRLKRRGANGPSLRDELADIVKEDPDAAVNILRTWIGNAS